MADAPTPPAKKAPQAAAPARSIRSFVVRAGRLGPGQSRALADLGPRFVIPYAPQRHDFDASFGRHAPRVLEIGFGMGDATATIAQGLPGTDFIGVEVHTPGVGALLKRIGEMGLANLRLIQHDAVEVLEHMIEPASLAGVHVFFPDPWHKKKHNKRRLIQGEFVRLLASRLESGAHSLKDVARTCGFADEQNLRRAFRRHVGVAPSEYRERFG